MQVTETLAEGLKHEFQISVPASDLDAKADARLVDLKDKVRLNGFRPGKVPVSHLKKVYGRSVMAETVEQTIRDTNTKIFTERGFRLATEPKVTMPTEEKAVEDILTGKSDLNYTVSIEVVPSIQLADFKGFSVEKPVADVTDADVALTGIYQKRRRMTLTYPLLNRSRRVLWVATGSEKIEMLARLHEGDITIPAGRIRRDHALVIADQAAAGKISTS